jgi:hypothetical protein
MGDSAGGAGMTVADAIGNVVLRSLEAAEEKLDAEIDKLEKMDDDDMDRLRRDRMAKLKKVAGEQQKWLAQGHGTYLDCPDQRAFFDELKKESRAVVHFYRPSTRRCEIVDKHLGILARKHVETKFLRVDAEKSPFITDRLKIWALPTIVLVKDGKTEHSIVGFEDMGGHDDFTTETMERVLLAHGVLLETYCSF